MKKGRREKEEKEKEGRMEKREGGKASQMNAMITTQFQSNEKLLTEFWSKDSSKKLFAQMEKNVFWGDGEKEREGEKDVYMYMYIHREIDRWR